MWYNFKIIIYIYSCSPLDSLFIWKPWKPKPAPLHLMKTFCATNVKQQENSCKPTWLSAESNTMYDKCSFIERYLQNDHLWHDKAIQTSKDSWHPDCFMVTTGLIDLFIYFWLINNACLLLVIVPSKNFGIIIICLNQQLQQFQRSFHPDYRKEAVKEAQRKMTWITSKASAELEFRNEQKTNMLNIKKIQKINSPGQRLTFHRFPHSLHKTNVVIGSSALLVCTWNTHTHKARHCIWTIIYHWLVYFYIYKCLSLLLLDQWYVWNPLGCRCNSSSCTCHTAAGLWWSRQFWPFGVHGWPPGWERSSAVSAHHWPFPKK